MGCGVSSESSNSEGSAVNKSIEKEISALKKAESETVRMLILGAADSGKSTFLKQFQVMNGKITDDMRTKFKENIQAAIVRWVNITTSSVNAEQGDEYGACVAAFRAEEQRTGGRSLDPVMLKVIQNVLSKPGFVADLAKNNGEKDVPLNASWYFERIETLADPLHVPSDDEIVMLRVATAGVRNINFSVHGKTLIITDVGGQRAERKKWLNCFDGVACVLYCVALDEFDMVLTDDPTVNRMTEALTLFKNTIDHSAFNKKPFIIMFNKSDLLVEKLKRKAFAVPGFASREYKSVLEHIQGTYSALIDDNEHKTYMYTTTATAAESARKIWDALVDVVRSYNAIKSF